MAGKVSDFLIGAGAFYVLVTVNFLLLSRPIVPTTHLIGILAFHGLFLIFGFATARSLNVLLVILLGAATIYLIAIARYAVMFGDLEQDGYLHDIFGFGEPAVFVTFHQNIGFMFGLAVIALFGLVSNRIGAIFFLGALPAVLLFLFYISARGALVAILCSLIFWLGAELWLRSRKVTLAGIAVIALMTALTSGFFYRYALHDKSVDAKAPDAISRTIRRFRIQGLVSGCKFSREPGIALPLNRTNCSLAGESASILSMRVSVLRTGCSAPPRGPNTIPTMCIWRCSTKTASSGFCFSAF